MIASQGSKTAASKLKSLGVTYASPTKPARPSGEMNQLMDAMRANRDRLTLSAKRLLQFTASKITSKYSGMSKRLTVTDVNTCIESGIEFENAGTVTDVNTCIESGIEFENADTVTDVNTCIESGIEFENAGTVTDVNTCIESGIEFEDAGRVLETDECLEYRLPSHHRCACQSFNLLSGRL